MFTTRNSVHFRKRTAGLTLIELVIFIVVVSIAVVGILGVMSYTTNRSADPLVRKQALAVAEALLEEVELMPFTTCDPAGYDPATGICTLPETLGPEPGEARGSTTQPFDNVNDYNGFTLSGGGTDLGGSGLVTVPAGYSAKVTITPENAFGPAGATVPNAAVLKITVAVTYNGSNQGNVVLEGYRTQYAPTP